MAVTESAKHNLYTYLEETMGQERATTLMEMVSPTGWADVATKQDLKHEIALLRTELKGEIGGLRNELTATFERGLRTQLFAIYAFNGIFMSLAVGLAQAIN